MTPALRYRISMCDSSLYSNVQYESAFPVAMKHSL